MSGKTLQPQRYRDLLRTAAWIARASLECGMETREHTMRLCMHQAELTRILLACHPEIEDVPAVRVGGISLVLGRDSVSKLEMRYDPLEVDEEWHAWVEVGSWIVDASIADLHKQLISRLGSVSYQRLSPFREDVFAMRRFQAKKHGAVYDGIPTSDHLYELFRRSAYDQELVTRSMRYAYDLIEAQN